MHDPSVRNSRMCTLYPPPSNSAGSVEVRARLTSLVDGLRRELQASSVLALPCQKWTAVREPNAGDDEECALCMESFVESDEVRVLKCRHYFHTTCIDQWLVVSQKSKSRSCPLCPAGAVELAA